MLAAVRYIGALALMTWCAPAFAQLSPEMEQQSKRGSALLYCAILAAEGTESTKSQASSLATRATDTLIPVMIEIQPQLTAGTNGPLNAYIAGRSPEFMLGLNFAAVASEIRTLLDGAAKFGEANTSYDTVKMLREWKAEAEFQDRNCALL